MGTLDTPTKSSVPECGESSREVGDAGEGEGPS
jgi:hypothetical protein